MSYRNDSQEEDDSEGSSLIWGGNEKGNRIPRGKRKNPNFLFRKGKSRPLGILTPFVSPQDKIEQEEDLEEEEAAPFEGDSMDEYNPSEEGSETERKEGCLVSQENQIEKLSDEDDELANISSEEE